MNTPGINLPPWPFAGRARLYLSEAARVLKVPQVEVVTMIQRGELSAVSVLNDGERETKLEMQNTPRNTWRVVSDSLKRVREKISEEGRK